MSILLALRGFKGELPDPLARLKRDHPLENYTEEELVCHLEGILGTGAADVLGLAGVYGAEEPTRVAKSILLFALHMAIVEANAHGQPQGTTLYKPGRQDPWAWPEVRGG